MLVREKTRHEIEAKVNKMGDYVKIDYLSSCLKEKLDFDTRKYVLIALSKLYENKGMYSEAAKLMQTSAEINVNYQGKINDFMKACELYIKCGRHIEADVAMRNALGVANTMEKHRIKESVKQFYLIQAKMFVSRDRRAHAVEAYEKLLESFDLDVNERADIKSRLLNLYDGLGRVKDYMNLKKQM